MTYKQDHQKVKKWGARSLEILAVLRHLNQTGDYYQFTVQQTEKHKLKSWEASLPRAYKEVMKKVKFVLLFCLSLKFLLPLASRDISG